MFVPLLGKRWPWVCFKDRPFCGANPQGDVVSCVEARVHLAPAALQRALPPALWPAGRPLPPTPTAPPTAVSSEPGSWPEGSPQICWCGVGRVKDSWNPSVDRDPGLPEDRGVLVTRPVHRTHQVTFCYLERLSS